MSLFCWFDHFLDSGAEICQNFHWFLEKFKASKRHSEINWPLGILLGGAFRVAQKKLTIKKCLGHPKIWLLELGNKKELPQDDVAGLG